MGLPTGRTTEMLDGEAEVKLPLRDGKMGCTMADPVIRGMDREKGAGPGCLAGQGGQR